MKAVRTPVGRHLTVGLAVAATLTLAACSSTNSSSGDKSSTKADIAVGKVGTMDQFADISSVCGDKPVKVGIVDGFGTNSWSKTVKAEIESEAAKCSSVTGVEYAAGRGDLQATNQAVVSMAAKGVDLILVIPDAGPGAAQLPSIRRAEKSGATVVPFASDPTGKAGTDYLDYTDWQPSASGKVWAEWMVKQLGDKGGNIVFLGGPAGAAVTAQEYDGIKEVLAANPQVKLLNSDPVVTNWDPAQAQQAMSGLLSRYPKIDGLIVDYGTAAGGVIRAYESAGKKLPPLATTDDNSLSCGYTALKAKNPGYQLATVSSRTWIGRVALRKGLAAIEGKSDTEPSLYSLGLAEDSTGGTTGAKSPADACLKDAPPDATPSSLLTADELAKIFG
jgi:ribose transport system substrate-binding protein